MWRCRSSTVPLQTESALIAGMISAMGPDVEQLTAAQGNESFQIFLGERRIKDHMKNLVLTAESQRTQAERLRVGYAKRVGTKCVQALSGDTT